jgi:hypothetical protein
MAGFQVTRKNNGVAQALAALASAGALFKAGHHIIDRF